MSKIEIVIEVHPEYPDFINLIDKNSGIKVQRQISSSSQIPEMVRILKGELETAVVQKRTNEELSIAHAKIAEAALAALDDTKS